MYIYYPAHFVLWNHNLSVWKQYQLKVFLAALAETAPLLPPPSQSRQLFARTDHEPAWLALRNLQILLSSRSVPWSSSHHRHTQLSHCKYKVDTGAAVTGYLTSIAKHLMWWSNALGEVSAWMYFHPMKTEHTLNLELLSFSYKLLWIPFYYLSMLLLVVATHRYSFWLQISQHQAVNYFLNTSTLS